MDPTGGHPLVQAVDEVVEVAVGAAHHADPVPLRQLVQVELTVLPPRIMKIFSSFIMFLMIVKTFRIFFEKIFLRNCLESVN